MISILKIAYENKRPIAGVVSVILLIFAFFSLMKSFVFYESEGEIAEKSRNGYSSISTEYLGKYLSEKYPGSKAIIFYDSVSTSEAIVNRLIGLRKSLEGNIDIVREVGLPTKIPDGIPPHMLRISEHIYASDFDNAIKATPRANLVISLVGLPEDIAEMNIWRIHPLKRPKVAVFGGSIRKLHKPIKSGLIHAVVTFKRMDNSVNKLPPKDLEKAFHNRFMLFTPDNFKASTKKKKKVM